MVPFSEYPSILVRMFNSAIREPSTYLAILSLYGDSDGRLDFIQNMEYKYIELMSCDCEASTVQAVQQHITYRYNTMKRRLCTMQGKLYEVTSLVKQRNPSLLVQLQKSSESTTSSVVQSSSITLATKISHTRHKWVFAE